MTHADALALIEVLDGIRETLSYMVGVLLGGVILRVIFR